MKGWLAVVSAAIFLAIGVPAAPAMAQNWNAEITQTAQGYRVGDPEAPLQIIEFVSYSCPHCAVFERDSEAELRYFYVHEGYAAVEVRHLIRNPMDLAAALLTECGAPERFFDNHRAVMVTQATWLEKARGLSQAQRQRWNSGPSANRMRAVAADLEFDKLMENRGLSASAIHACLSDEARAQEISELSRTNAAEFDVPGTPSFVLNGSLLEGVHGWIPLRQVLVATRGTVE